MTGQPVDGGMHAPSRPVATVSPNAGAQSLGYSAPLVLLFYAFLLPAEIRFDIAGLQIYPHRMAFIGLLPWVLMRKADRIDAIDLMLLAAATWMTVSFSVYYGIQQGFVRGAALAFDVLAAYFIARRSIRSLKDLRIVLIMIAPGLLLAGLSMAAESITHSDIVHPAAAKVFGALPVYEGGEEVGTADIRQEIRLGLMRARGAFAHAILAGVFLASMMGLYLFSGIRKWPLLVGMLAGFMAIFSVSSAAIFALLIVCGLYLYDGLQKRVSFLGWHTFLAAVGIFLMLGQVGSNTGIAGIIIRLSLNPATGAFRLLIWEYGMQSIYRNPWFGIGFTAYERLPWMVESVDNHWLLMGIRHGFLVPMLMLAAFITTIVMIGRAAKRQAKEADRNLCVGLAVVLSVIVLSGFSVALFGALASWIFVVLGIAVSIKNLSLPPPRPARGRRIVPPPIARTA